MISQDGWFSWMIRDPGPLSKTNGGVNTVKGVVPHSAEGFWPHLQTLLHSEARRASWAFSNLKDGRCFQHYSIYSQTWTSGAGYPNNNFVAWENEGVAGEPLTQKQTDNIVQIIRELSALKGWTAKRPLNGADLSATCYEHTECVRWGAAFTACPSGRVPWTTILDALEDDDMKPFLAWDLGLQTVYLIGPFGAAHVVYPADLAVFETMYGKLSVALSHDTVAALEAA